MIILREKLLQTVLLFLTISRAVLSEDEQPEIKAMPDITVANVLAELEKDKDNNTSLLATLLDNVKYLISPGLVSNNTKCREDSERYWNEVMKGYHGQLWALKMLDSDGSLPPFAYFFNNDENLGKFGECLDSVSNDTLEQERVTAQYCLYSYSVNREVLEEKYGANKRLKRAAEFFSKTIEFYQRTTERGICVPASCSYDDVQAGIELYLNPMGVLVHLSEYDCVSRLEPKLSNGIIMMLIFLGILGASIISATVYDLYHRVNDNEDKQEKKKTVIQNDLIYTLVPYFSIPSNIEKLGAVKPNDLDFLNGLRVLARCWVTVGYGHAMLMTSMQMNAENVYLEVYKWHVNVCLACKLGVDAFFFLSSFLTSYLFYLALKGNHSCWNVMKTALMSYVHRYLRLLPAYACMVAMYSTLFFYVAEGPIWKKHVKGYVENCHENWWKNLLFINGVTDAPGFSKCIQPSWFLSLDMIYWLLSPPLLALLLYTPVFGTVSMVVLFASTALTTMFYNSIEDMPEFLVNLVPPGDVNGNLVATFRKSCPAIAGLLCGYFYFKKPKRRLSQRLVTVLWWISAVSAPVLLFGGFQMLQLVVATVRKVYDVYTVSHRPLWCILLFWVVFACSQGYGGPLKAVLSWGVFSPISKMMLSMFLVSYPVQVWLFYSKKQVPFYDDAFMNLTSVTQVVLLVFYGFFFYILIECPLTGLTRVVFDKLTKGTPKIKTG